jgi:hypothetical protein
VLPQSIPPTLLASVKKRKRPGEEVLYTVVVMHVPRLEILERLEEVAEGPADICLSYWKTAASRWRKEWELRDETGDFEHHLQPIGRLLSLGN